MPLQTAAFQSGTDECAADPQTLKCGHYRERRQCQCAHLACFGIREDLREHHVSENAVFFLGHQCRDDLSGRTQSIDQTGFRFAPERSQQKCVNRIEIPGLFRPDQRHEN